MASPLQALVGLGAPESYLLVQFSFPTGEWRVHFVNLERTIVSRIVLPGNLRVPYWWVPRAHRSGGHC